MKLTFGVFEFINNVYQVRIHSFLEKTKQLQRQTNETLSQEDLSRDPVWLRKRIKWLIKKNRLVQVQKLLKNEEFEPWGQEIRAKVCFCLFLFALELIMNEVTCSFMVFL